MSLLVAWVAVIIHGAHIVQICAYWTHQRQVLEQIHFLVLGVVGCPEKHQAHHVSHAVKYTFLKNADAVTLFFVFASESCLGVCMWKHTVLLDKMSFLSNTKRDALTPAHIIYVCDIVWFSFLNQNKEAVFIWVRSLWVSVENTSGFNFTW